MPDLTLASFMDTFLASANESAAWTNLSKPANVASFGALANANGVLKNDGAGVLSYLGTTEGGNGISDSGKIPLYSSDGGLCATLALVAKGNGSDPGFMQLWSADNSKIGQLDFDGADLANWLLRGTGGSETIAFLSDLANPSASVGLSAVNGVAATFMRSDAAPALDVGIAPTWTGQHTWASGSITTSKPLAITQTWNAGEVTFNSLLVNITDTASAAASLLMDLQVGGSSKFKVSKAGNVTTPGSLVGGNLTIAGGINMAGLPTSSAGLTTGDIWNNEGVLNVVP